MTEGMFLTGMNLKAGKDGISTLTLQFKGTVDDSLVRDLQKLLVGYKDYTPMALPANASEVPATVTPPKSSVKVGKATLVPVDAPPPAPDGDPGMDDDFAPAPPRARSPLDELADELGQ